jgi:hypothetical protein
MGSSRDLVFIRPRARWQAGVDEGASDGRLHVF